MGRDLNVLRHIHTSEIGIMVPINLYVMTSDLDDALLPQCVHSIAIKCSTLRVNMADTYGNCFTLNRHNSVVLAS